MDQTKQNQKHLIAAVSGLTRIIKNIQNHLEDMDNNIRSLRRDMDIIHMEMYIESMAGLIESKTFEMLRYLDEVTEGIYDALAKRLSPKIVDPSTMNITTTNIKIYYTSYFKLRIFDSAEDESYFLQ